MRRLCFRSWLASPAVMVCLLAAGQAVARVGGGEHYSSGRGLTSDDGGGDDMVGALVYLALRHPKVGIPLLIIVGVAWFLVKRNGATARTQRAFDQREAQARTTVSAHDVSSWVNQLKRRDPAFDLAAFLEKARALFVRVQEAWFRRRLQELRPFVSDATFQRLCVQARLLEARELRDAVADLEVRTVQMIGLDQNPWYETVHLRVTAGARDTDVPSSYSDDQALATAKKAPLETFTEVWSFVRKPGTQTKVGQDLFQGKCPHCGAPFQGGATNRCAYCGAVVNSGNYDWTLAEITQGVEHVHQPGSVPGLDEVRVADPALGLELLEDRASLIFWKWVEAESTGEPARLSKVAAPAFRELLGRELSTLGNAGRRRVFHECAVGGVIVQRLHVDDGREVADIEVRWSARLGNAPRGGPALPSGPTVPQRSVLTLTRKQGATTPTANGLATARCPQCSAPLAESADETCEHCGLLLASGERDWILERIETIEQWRARRATRVSSDVVVDVKERERLLYLMASVAAADGVVDERERKLLKLCATRWRVPWANVELALGAQQSAFDRLVPKGSPEAGQLMQSLVQMALVDGRVDRRERQLLEQAALHLGVSPNLDALAASPKG